MEGTSINFILPPPCYTFAGRKQAKHVLGAEQEVTEATEILQRPPPGLRF